ncbi:alpha/beta hydrolase family esterase [Pseudorhodobacter turbinis]|uniref:extracellular catalytic domain type 1 short-chain-length polyhydroxyalkanoate depolymerase n=1 Tax=Pseudorhodobacter turbinis TaxID=2500533 RepID=UPI0023EFC51B|nr:PHB depolymerase family esterase [Pseudorhodobacter turbinis]
MRTSTRSAKTIGKTTATKANSQTPAKTAPARGASFKTGTHKSVHGYLQYKLYVPSVAQRDVIELPLVVMLHGCGQTADDFARGTGMNALAEQLGFLVLYPDQSRRANIGGCWNWFKPEHQCRDTGEPALIASLTLQIVAEQNADEAKVYVAGLSAGASMALILGTAYPDVFAAVGVHSGLAVGAAHDAVSVMAAMQAGNPGQCHHDQLPTIIFHGAADKVVNARNGRFVAMRALEPYDNLVKSETKGRVRAGQDYTRTRHRVGEGRPYIEHWLVHDAGHAWSGGNPTGTYTDQTGPNASQEMIRFFLRHRTTKKRRSMPSSK